MTQDENSISSEKPEEYILQAIDEETEEILYRSTFSDLRSLEEQKLKLLQRKYGRGSRLTLEEAMRLYTFTGELPSIALLRQAITESQKTAGCYFQKLALMLGTCLFFRTQKIPGDPIRNLLAANSPEVVLLHTTVWSLTTAFETIHNLILLLWEPITDELAALSDAPQDSLDLLLEVIREHIDYCYELCLLNLDSMNARKAEETAAAFKTYVLTPHSLKPKQKKLLAKDAGSRPFFWLSIVLEIAEQDFKTYENQAAENLLSAYKHNIGLFFEQTAKYHRKRRKEGKR
ncbi:hypothetical protein HW132_33205 [Brasilonema sp. CT11]|nr:hypothetical protein [Brasilonema sp. CT11]